MPFSLKFSSPAKKAAKYEKDLRSALQAGNRPKAVTAFTTAFNYLCQEHQAQLLSDLVLTYESQIADAAFRRDNLSSAGLKAALALLIENHLDEAALLICEDGGFSREPIDLLARRGRDADLAQYLARDRQVDSQQLADAITAWENYHGDVRLNSTLSEVLSSIGRSMPERLPDNPRAKELGGQFKTAALLYVKEGRLADAAKCYEQADLPVEASRIYEYLGDSEAASQTAEAAGDLERALQFVVKPERKIKLLIQLGKFREARDFAPGLPSPAEYFDLIREQARQQMMIKLRGHDFSGALELAEFAECEPSERQDIVQRGRQAFDSQIAMAASQAELQELYRACVDFEERAGQFEKAGQLAEEVLGDLNRASLLYEKANLYNRAIETASQSSGEGSLSATQIRLAELHERGGNLLNAARLYESAGQFEKASTLYENTQHFSKAIECYLKTPEPEQAVLVRLYTGAGEYEKTIELYLKAGTVPDLEKALELATTHKLASHSRVIREKLATLTAGDEQDLERCFTQAKDEVRGMYSTIMGIDFGTTNSVAAIFNKASGKVEIIPTDRGTEFEPSFFGVDDDSHPIFGEAARLRSLTAPECVAARVKRSLGELASFSIRGKSYRCEEIVAHVLQRLRSNAVAYLRAKVDADFHDRIKRSSLVFPTERLQAFLRSHPNDFHMTDVVLSVPAYFNDNQKRATRDSAEIAGLHVRRLLHEPTAAALAYCHQRAYSGKVAVIDLGGGTLDISIVDIGEGVAEVRAIGGDAKLGGSDIDALLVQQVVNHLRATWGVELTEQTYPREMARLRDACETLKIDLSQMAQSSLDLPHFLNKPRFTYTLSRADLEKLAALLLGRIQSVLSATLKDYGRLPDRFLLIGNATKMPAIGELVKAQLPVKQLQGIDPGTAVAMGAALEGAVLAGDSQQVVVLDIVPFSLGIVVSPDQGDEVMNFLIAKNSTIPIKKSSMCTTKVDNQPNVHLRIYQGEAPQPPNNYFLGEFVLEGIPPAKAHEPAIDVRFDIGADCILTVTAVDQGTNHSRSIRIERAVALSLQEKRNLSLYFEQKEKAYSAEKDLERTRADIEALKQACTEALQTAERAVRDFFERFHERVEVNARLYRANAEQIAAIQEMFIQKDQFLYGLPRYHDRLASIISNLRQTEAPHLDFSDQALMSRLQKRVTALTNYRRSLEELRTAIEQDVTRLVTGWIQTLDSLEPDTAKMTPLQEAKYHLVAGRARQANDILEAQATGADGLTVESFQLLLQCQVVLGSREAYRATCQRYGSLFGLVFPDFSRLNAYLRAIEESIFLIQGVSTQVAVSGSGFCFAPQLVVTNRHVVEGLLPANVKLIGRHGTHQVERIECDPTHDIAILRVAELLKPLRLGESSFAEPGEQVLAIGFPAPDSAVHSENIYISSGIVNSIRKTPLSPERVIFVDAKIRGGMSGGPLINDLGEVVGIVTLVQIETRQSQQGMLQVGDQPTALPIQLIRKYTQYAG